MKRSLLLLGVATVALAVACNEPTGPRSGGIALRLVSAGAAGQTQAGSLDSIRVSVTGPTNKTAESACTATTCSVTVDGLDPGTYSVVVAGIAGGAIDHYGTASSIAVTAGQTASATVGNWASFVPVLTLPYDTTGVLQFPVVFSKVAAATSYVLEWSKAQTFTGAKADTLTDTTATIVVADSGQYYVRVRAVNANVGSSGRTSPAQAVFAFQAVATVNVLPATATIAAGATQQFTAYALDANSDTVKSVTYYWASSNPNIATVDQNGLATGVAGAGGSVTITAVGKGQPGSAALSVGAQTATKLAFSVQPGNTVAGKSISPAVQVEVRDANGNLVTTARDAVTIAFANNAGSGTLSGTQQVNAINGIASFSGLWIDKAAAGYTLSASSGSLTSATSTAFAVSPGAPAELGFAVQPSNALGNATITPAVQVTINDLYNNPTTATSQVTISLGANPWATAFSPGGKLSGTLTVAATSGVASFSTLTVDKPGPGYKLLASSGALTSALSDTFRVSLLAQQVAIGNYHMCALMSTGTYCWGRNSEGQLGTGTYLVDSVAALTTGGQTFKQVTTGGYHSCGLTAAGAAYCWGYNGYGELGDGTNNTNNQPVAVSGSLTFASIAAGQFHTCGVTTAGAVYCWGNNGSGQLGNNSTTNTNAPVAINLGAIPATAKGVSLALGASHSCVLADNSAIYCWGANGNGELGNASTPSSLIPVLVAGSKTWTMVTAGQGHTCGVDVNSDPYCWGYYGFAQIGDGTTTDRSSPTLVGGGLKLAAIAAGGYFTCGLLSSNGSAYCWGDNYQGQLGDNQASGNTSSAPVAVSGGLSFAAIRAGLNDACGRASTTVYCWGYNSNGELGNGTRGVPGLVPGKIVQ